MNRTQQQLGFTLFELLVTLGIIAILAAIAIPSFAGSIARSRAEDLAVQFYSALTGARTEAITTNQVVQFTMNSCSWTISGGGNTNPVTTTPSVASGVNCVVTSGATAQLIFRPDGSIAQLSGANLAQPLVISNRGGGAIWTTSVATTGQITKVLN